MDRVKTNVPEHGRFSVGQCRHNKPFSSLVFLTKEGNVSAGEKTEATEKGARSHEGRRPGRRTPSRAGAQGRGQGQEARGAPARSGSPQTSVLKWAGRSGERRAVTANFTLDLERRENRSGWRQGRGKGGEGPAAERRQRLAWESAAGAQTAGPGGTKARLDARADWHAHEVRKGTKRSQCACPAPPPGRCPRDGSALTVTDLCSAEVHLVGRAVLQRTAGVTAVIRKKRKPQRVGSTWGSAADGVPEQASARTQEAIPTGARPKPSPSRSQG